MVYLPLPSQPIRFVFEIALFAVLIVPSILWTGLAKLWPAKRKSVRGQVVLITGSARGLGRELALRFSKLGAKIACVDINETGNNETAEMIKIEGGVSFSYKCDVSNRDQIKVMHSLVNKDMGPVDILINNAGIVWGNLLADPTTDQFIINLINVNLMGPIWMIREILPSMLKRNSGHVVTMSSLSSMYEQAGISTYTVTKWGLNGLMGSLHNELKEYKSNVKTSTIIPYFIETNPEISKFLHIRIPEIPVKIAGKLMVNGILEEQKVFSIPSFAYHLTNWIRLLPDNLQTLYQKIFYVNILPDETAIQTIKEFARN